jgi:hypothetical protein
MFRLFWTQNENPNVPNTFITTDGEILTLDQDENEGADLFSELISYQESSMKIYKSRNLLISKHPIKGFFISSNFSEKDDFDRNMGFMFFTEHTDRKDVISDLLFFSNIVSRNLTDKDLTDLNRKLPHDSNRKQILKLIIAAIAVLTAYLIWKQIN